MSIKKRKLPKLVQMAEKAMREGVKKALERHAQLGVPAVFMQNGKLCYQLPSGKIVHKIK